MKIIVSGGVGCGKSSIALVILDALRSIGVTCTWSDELSERNLGPGADDVQALGVWPVVTLQEVVERPIPPPTLVLGTNIEIPIPMGCSCKDVEIGSYANQIELPTPKHMLDLGQLGCLSFRPTTCVDRCIAPVVQALWALGVVTTGCCCGHNVRDGYIGIWSPKC